MVETLVPTEATVTTLQLQKGEPLIIPDVFKSALGLEEGGAYAVVRIDGIVLLIARPLVSLEVLERMREAFNAANVTLEDLLAGLAQVRTQLFNERYGLAPSP